MKSCINFFSLSLFYYSTMWSVSALTYICVSQQDFKMVAYWVEITVKTCFVWIIENMKIKDYYSSHGNNVSSKYNVCAGNKSFSVLEFQN